MEIQHFLELWEVMADQSISLEEMMNMLLEEEAPRKCRIVFTR